MQSLDLKEELIHYQLNKDLKEQLNLIKEICGGEVSKFDIQKIENIKINH